MPRKAPKPKPVASVPYVLKKLGISQSELARRMGVPRQRISEWVSGTHKMGRLYREKLQQVYQEGKDTPPLVKL